MVRVAEMDREVEAVDADEVSTVVRRCQDDLKFLYRDILLDGKPEYQDAIEDSKLHDLLFDFLRWDELGNGLSTPHTNLKEYVGDGTVWLHWRKLDEDPLVYKGDEHELAEKWKRGDLIRGVVIRLAGDGHNKYVLLPRFHLKTEIAHVAFTLQEIIRDPSIRSMSKTHTKPLAEKIIERVKDAWKLETFSRYFGQLKPDIKEAGWNERYIQVRSPRRGVGHTVEASAVEVETVGSHPDLIILDDVIGFENLSKKEKVRAHVETLAFVLGAEGRVLGIGTRYAPDDPHGLFLDHGTPLFKSTSFMFATLEDENKKPVWNYMTKSRLERLRERCTNEFIWYCQMFNNPFQVEAQKLKSEWWRKWPRPCDTEILQKYLLEGQEITPELAAEYLHLDICVTLDPASSERKRSDCSACIVQGQTQDREFRLVLDGFRKKLSRDELPGVFVDLLEKWMHITRRARTRFVVGVEDSGLGTYLKFPIEDLMRKRGFNVEIQPLKHRSRAKVDRIYRLASPYRLGSILYPEKLDCGGYDLIETLKHQYLHFPRGGDGEDDLLDAQAYQEDLLLPINMPGRAFEAKQAPKANDIVDVPQPQHSSNGRYVPESFAGQKGRQGRWVPQRFTNGR